MLNKGTWNPQAAPICQPLHFDVMNRFFGNHNSNGRDLGVAGGRDQEEKKGTLNSQAALDVLEDQSEEEEVLGRRHSSSTNNHHHQQQKKSQSKNAKLEW